jgi:TRAP-type C4-dicarboxylate transport system permease small subunit
VEIVLQALSIAFFGLLVIHGIPLVERTMRQLSSAIRIPMGYIYMSIPVGSALILLFAIERLIRIGDKGPEGATTA